MASEGHLGFNEALFTAVSALSVTGLTVIHPAVDLTVAGKVVLMCLIQVGGVGYMVFAVLAFRIMGRQISLTDRMALQDSLGLLNLSGIVELTKKVFVTVLSIEAVGALLLFLHWRGSMEDDRAAFFALFHAVSGFCNAGFDLFGAQHEFPSDPVSLVILGGLIVLGTVGIPVLFDLIHYPQKRKLTLHSRLTLITSAGLWVWGMVALTISEGFGRGVLADMPLGRQLGLSLFQSMSCRSAGFAVFPNYDDISPASELLMITLMFIGGAPASMGGGITTGTFVVLVLAMVAYIRRMSTPIVWGKAIPGEMVRKASAVLTISLALVVTGSWIIMVSHDVSMDKAVFEVVSAFATCGLTVGHTPMLNEVGQAVIIFMMFWGRLGALTILFALTRPRPARRVSYPEEKVLIG